MSSRPHAAGLGAGPGNKALIGQGMMMMMMANSLIK